MLFKQKLLKARKVTVYETLERPLVPVLVQMEVKAYWWTVPFWRDCPRNLATAQALIETEIHKLAGTTFNIGSPKQLGDILFGQMGLQGGRKTATGAWSTDSDALEDLAAQGVPMAKRVLDWRQLAKLRSTYTDALQTYINPQYGPRAHILCHGINVNGPLVVNRSQFAEHSRAHGRRPPHPNGLHRTARPQTGECRLFAN